MKRIKRIVSVMLTVAMVITSINYTPTTVNAADDYKGLTYTDLTNNSADWTPETMQGAQYAVAENNGVAVTFATALFQPTGTAIELYFAVNGTATPLTDAKVNGNEITIENTGLHISPAADMLTYEYNVLTFLEGDGNEIKIVIWCPANAGNGTYEEPAETTTEEASTEAPEIEWKTDATLTAALGDGAKYAATGSVPTGEMQIQSEQLWWISGADMGAVELSVNGTVPEGASNTGNSALGYGIKYSTLDAGINTIIVTMADQSGVEHTYTYYVQVPVTVREIYVNNYVASTGKYIVKFENIDGAASYKVYVDGNATDITLGGSGDYISYDELSAYDTGSHNIQITAVMEDGTETAKSSSVSINKPASAGDNNDIAQIYVQTDDTSLDPLTGMSKTKVTAAITVIDTKGVSTDVYDDAGKTTIKVRGNSTAGAEKKAFNISFSSKFDLFGFGAAKKWSLLANAFDKSLIRNKIAMDFGTDVLNIPYNSQSRFIDLYLNGRYMGNYLCIESVETGTNRVDIDAENAESNDILLELDAQGRDVATDEHLTARTSMDVFFAVNSPEADPSDETEHSEYITQYGTKLENALTYLNNFESALQKDDWEEISSYIDVESFVSFYLVSEVFKNQDIAFSSTRFYIKDNKLYAGPMWDYDLSTGNLRTQTYGGEYSEEDRSPEGYKATTFKWFEYLMNNATFKAMVVEKYKEVLPSLENLYADGGTIDETIQEIENSISRNYASTDEGGAGWSVTEKDSGDSYSYAAGAGWSSYDEAISYYKEWLASRVAFLSSEWLSDEPVEEAPDLVEVKANAPEAAGKDGWINPTAGTNAKNVNTDGTLYYYIAESYYIGGTNNSFFDNGNVYGFFASGENVPYGGDENNAVKGEAYAFSSNQIAGKLQSVWIDGEKLTEGTDWYCNNNDVLTISSEKFGLEAGETEKIYYVSIRTTEADYSWPVKVATFDQSDIEIPSMDDENWVEFTNGAENSTNVATSSGDKFYIQSAFKAAASNTANMGLYANTASLENPGWGVPLTDANAEKPIVSYVFGNGRSIEAIVIDGNRYNADGVNVSSGDVLYAAQSLFDLNGEDSHIFKVSVIMTSGEILGFALKVVSDKEEITTLEETTTQEEITTPEETTTQEVVTEPADAVWTLFGNSDTYWYYIPSGNEGAIKVEDAQLIQQTEGLYFGMWIVPSNIKVNGISVTNLMPGNGAEMRLSYDDFSVNGIYEVTFTGSDDKDYVLYVKRDTPKDYTPVGLAATVDNQTGLVNIQWTASADAEAAGFTYEVLVGENKATVVGTTATYQLAEGAYDTYQVTVNTLDGDGNVVGTVTTSVAYKDPSAIDTTVTFKDNQWEKWRNEEISWTKVDEAVGYAVYADGKLYQTIDSADTLSITIPAYVFANGTNESGQATTVGTHTTTVVALMEGDTAAENLSDVDAKKIMGANEFSLYVNYIFGNGTDIWNDSGVDSPWNFTVCEDAAASDIDEGASVTVVYDTDGAANLKIIDVGKHSNNDQQWTIKAAIYDEEIGEGNFINLSFDIKGPATLVGQQIMIKCIAEEVLTDGNYAGDPYEEKIYTFEEATDANGDKYAVIHYSNSFESSNDTYDLLFGLGLLDPDTINDGASIDLTLSDTSITKVYGLTSLSPSPVVNTEDISNSSIFVSWETDVPSHLANEYTYNVYIDGELANLPEGDTYRNNLTYAGYAAGQHTVKVESIYNGAVTSTKEATVTIEQVEKPDLVVTNISIPEGEYHIGDTVEVSVTVKNIGTVKAEGYGNMAIFFYVNGNRYNDVYHFVNAEDDAKRHTLDAGESYTCTFNYTIAEEDDKGGYLFDIGAKVDGDGNYAAVESNANNNTYKETFKFYAKITEVTMTNAGDHIYADWADHDETNARFDVTYVSGGVEYTISTSGNVSELDLSQDVWLDYQSQVTVTSIHTDGSKHTFAIGVALPDLVISNVEFPKNAYAVGEVVPIKATMENVGVAVAMPNNGNLTLKPAKDGAILTNNVQPQWRTLADEGLEQKLGVYDTFTYTFDYTVQEADLTAGSISLGGYADADATVDEMDETNNTSEKSVKIMEKGTLQLDSNNGDGPVTAVWSAADDELVTGYKLTYTTDGETYKEFVIDDTNVVYNADTNEYTYTFPTEEGIYNETDVSVLVKFDTDDYYDYASDKAMADLIITNVTGPNEKGEQVKVKVNFDLTVTVKNIGTAMVAPTTDDLDGYGKQIFVTLSSQTGVEQVISKGHYQGLTVGATTDFTLTDVVVTEKGQKDLLIIADDAGWDWNEDPAQNIGYIPESDETNNTYTYTVNAVIEQNPMDWTPLTVAQGSDEVYGFKVAQGTKDAHIEFKVVDTSNKDIDYKDIVTKYTGYNLMYMSIGFNPNYTVMTVEQNDEEGQVISTVPYWAYINKKDVETDIHTLSNCSILDVEGWDIDGIGVDGEPVQKEKVPGTHLNADGNGFNMNVDDFDVNNHYLMKLYNKNGEYVVLAFRVTDEYGEIGDWTKVEGKDMDNDGMPFYYHDASCTTTGSFWYNKNDMKLSNIAAYNGDHISVDLDTQYKINSSNHRIIITRGLLDADGDMIIPNPDGTVDGADVGSVIACTGGVENVDSALYYANEANYVSPSAYGINGNNKFQIKLPELMKEFPIHSALGGQKDNEYYYMKIFWDEDEHPGEYVSIPIRIKADIPMIEDVNGLVVAERGTSLSVQWTNTTSQNAHGYLYDIYIDGEKKAENVTAGAYSFSGYGQYKTYEIKVVAKWCEQEAETVVAYEVKEQETEPEETIPSDTPDIPRDDKWVLINGQNTLPISIVGTKEQTNATVYYYTDEDMYSVIGYNDYYISLNGNDKYFTGITTKIYVQNEDSTTFVSKTVYDSFYKGQTLMNASQMFSVPEDYVEGTEYFYVVRVAGDNGNTYKDFYFKVIPTKETSDVTNTGDWRLISGEYELPVQMGTESVLMGTVRFLDCPTDTEKYTGTNTYDIVGYNGYYMSIIGDNTYYTGEATKISVSSASETVLYAEDADNMEFVEKTIYDKVWPGQIIIKCEETFAVAYTENYYLLKVESGEKVTYIPVEITVNTGEVEVLGFQMNTNQNEGEVAAKNPSFRVVSKTSNVMTIGNKLYEVKKMGTVYAAADKVENLEDNMNLSAVESNEYVQKFEATERGKLAGYITKETGSEYNTYFALTFEFKDYMYHSLEQNYAFRAYAVLDDGTDEGQVVYGHNVYTVNMYEIAQNLYDNQKMGSMEAHNFLYMNILNLVDMDHNVSEIANAMFKAMGIKSYDDERYALVSEMTRDIYNYARCLDGYTYIGREQFQCKNVEDELLGYLNAVQDATYDSVYDWIYNETSNYTKKGVAYKGCYRLVDYGWDSTIDKDFHTE